MVILDGKTTSQHLLQGLKALVIANNESGKRAPHLCAILVGGNGASETYVASKIKHCAELGFQSSLLRFEETITEAELLAEIEKVNQNKAIDGLIVQVPLPKHINPETVVSTIDPAKDVDGFHPYNVGRLAKGLPTFISATPYGVIKMLEVYGVETSGKHAVIIGRSQIVGLPMALLLQRNGNPGNCTVTICHSKTKNLKEMCLQADILVAALGIPEFVKADMVKDGAVVIDVGITRVEDTSKKSGFAIKGDVDFAEVSAKSSFITPVPGGVGLMTIYGLLENTWNAYLGTYYPKNS
jgi:methylenetetrahydrofolate dehydrogenase (NADP+)/methenyltetrahydrofolate cyclohydrolase